MKCPQCGAQVDGDFCPYCGAANEINATKNEETPKTTPTNTSNTKAEKPKKPIYKKWWFWVLVVIVVLNIKGRLGGNNSSNDAAEFVWSDMVLSEMLPEPESNYGDLSINSDDYLSIDVLKTSKDEYRAYIKACRNGGFTVEVEEYGTTFTAKNEQGYELTLYYFESDEEMSIDLTAPSNTDSSDESNEESASKETEIVDESERTYEVARKFIELYNEKLDPDILNTKETIREDRILKYDDAYSIQGEIEGEYINVINYGSYDIKDEMRIDTYADTPDEVLEVLCNVSTAIGKPLTDEEISKTRQYLDETFADGGQGYTEWTSVSNIKYYSRYLHQGKTYEIQIEFPINKFYK